MRAWRKVMTAYRRVYDSGNLQADCQEPGSAPVSYAWQSSMGYLYPFLSPTEQQDLSQNLAENQSDWVQVITIFLTVHRPLCEFYISPSKLLLTLQSTAMDGAVSFADKMAWNSITRVLTTAQMLCTAATVWQVLFCCFKLVRHFLSWILHYYH